MRQDPLFDHHSTPSTVILTRAAPAAAAHSVLAELRRRGDAGIRVVTRSALAARALGVPHRSLTDVARAELARKDLRFAAGITRRAALTEAVELAWGSSDAVGTARAVEATVRELLAAGAGVGGHVVDEHPRVQRLLELTAEYRERLAADGLIDPADAVWLTAENTDGGARMLVAGYAFINPGELNYLTARAQPGSWLVLPCAPTPDSVTAVDQAAYSLNEQAAEALAERGWRVVRDAEPTTREAESATRPAEPATRPVPVISGGRFASPDAEARHVLTLVKRLLVDGVMPGDIVLAATDVRTYGPVVSDVGREYGVPVRAAYSEALAATPYGHLVASLVRVAAAGLPYEDTARLLLNRLVEPLGVDAWAAARRRLPRGATQWERYDPRAAQLAWPRRATRSQYLELLQVTLDGLGVSERLEEDARSARHHLMFFGTYPAPLAPEPTTLLDAFASEVGEHLQMVMVSANPAPEGAAGSVDLVPAAALPGAAVPHVYVLGVAEGVMPRRLEPGAWLDYVEREAARAAGIAVLGAQDAAQQEALQFDGVLMAATKTLTLTYAESGERGERLPSPYFAALGLDPGTPVTTLRGTGKPPASIEELRRELVATGAADALPDDAVLAGARAALAIETRRESDSPPDAHDGVIGVPYPRHDATFSATSLLALSQCGFKWFAQRVLGLAEPEEADSDLSPLVRGNLYHLTLEEAFKAAKARGAMTKDAVLAAVPDAFAIAERAEAMHTANWELHRGQHLATLQRVVRSDTFIPEDAEVQYSERSFGARHGSPADWRGFAVTGRIDRIDRRSGQLTLVDYKTSSSRPLGAKNDAGEAKVDLQLPIYLEAAVPALRAAGVLADDAEPDAATGLSAAAEYYSLTKARVILAYSQQPGSDGSGSATYDQDALQRVADRAVAALDAGRYPVEPDTRYQACAYCAFDSVCRVGPRIERKRGGGG